MGFGQLFVHTVADCPVARLSRMSGQGRAPVPLARRPPPNSDVLRLHLWKVPLSARLIVAPRLSIPFVCASRRNVSVRGRN